MKERIGIVVDSWKNGVLKGSLVESDIEIKINLNSQIEVKPDIFKSRFTYDTATGIYKVCNFNLGWEDCKKIGFELKKIGFDNVKMLYEGDVYIIFGENQVEREK